mmetsp:Transcript_4225/g.16489  ORF Transcript_4225/g.16489 Transcript_4225/m.16489 type:complete len:353 (-) Transcript_4225:113-1171(-)
MLSRHTLFSAETLRWTLAGSFGGGRFPPDRCCLASLSLPSILCLSYIGGLRVTTHIRFAARAAASKLFSRAMRDSTKNLARASSTKSSRSVCSHVAKCHSSFSARCAASSSSSSRLAAASCEQILDSDNGLPSWSKPSSRTKSASVQSSARQDGQFSKVTSPSKLCRLLRAWRNDRDVQSAMHLRQYPWPQGRATSTCASRHMLHSLSFGSAASSCFFLRAASDPKPICDPAARVHVIFRTSCRRIRNCCGFSRTAHLSAPQLTICVLLLHCSSSTAEAPLNLSMVYSGGFRRDTGMSEAHWHSASTWLRLCVGVGALARICTLLRSKYTAAVTSTRSSGKPALSASTASSS